MNNEKKMLRIAANLCDLNGVSGLNYHFILRNFDHDATTLTVFDDSDEQSVCHQLDLAKWDDDAYARLLEFSNSIRAFYEKNQLMMTKVEIAIRKSDLDEEQSDELSHWVYERHCAFSRKTAKEREK